MARVTNEDLLQTCSASTHEAADHLARLRLGIAATPERLLALRNQLRTAYCAAQELKTRMKQQK